MDRDTQRGLVFNIQKFSLHDGAGIRTLVFLKGCPLACRWCANPEGISPAVDLAYDPKKCIGTKECIRCRDVCEADAIRVRKDGKVEIDRERCTSCGLCADVCPSRALDAVGKWMTAEEVIRVVEEDGSFYARSGGGLTVSGGEPLLQAGYVVELLRKAQGRGIHTALETSGLCPWEDLERACGQANQVFFDVKTVDPEKHRQGTGTGNERILENLRRLCARFSGIPVIVRTPIIPGLNDTPAEITSILAFLRTLPRAVEYELLPYHGFGEPKYEQLGRAYRMRGLKPPSPEQMAALMKLANEMIPPESPIGRGNLLEEGCFGRNVSK